MRGQGLGLKGFRVRGFGAHTDKSQGLGLPPAHGFNPSLLNAASSMTNSGLMVSPKKLETGLRTNSAGIPYAILLRIEAIGFPTFGLLL